VRFDKFILPENKMGFPLPACRCNFVYDGLGNWYKKTCGQSEVQYIIDPFGNPGADVVGQVKHFQRFTIEHENN